eukprot:TRINITY_DN5091_c0_g1_i6.p4 TRINITY_DN5091_c0_g1~~TRINITY_DN5091_c0_g1_i6.p4  ORF type:complete len:154 (+),score=4.75 TRINITY_DN5091_c0_g1_i6:872-1333(+)
MVNFIVAVLWEGDTKWIDGWIKLSNLLKKKKKSFDDNRKNDILKCRLIIIQLWKQSLHKYYLQIGTHFGSQKEINRQICILSPKFVQQLCNNETKSSVLEIIVFDSLKRQFFNFNFQIQQKKVDLLWEGLGYCIIIIFKYYSPNICILFVLYF